MRKSRSLSILFLTCIFMQPVIADKQGSATQWERSSAMAAVRSVNIDVAVYEIGDISSLADGQSTVKNLKLLEHRNDWPLPAREAAVYQFTQSLAGLPRDAVASEVMSHLKTYQARTLVPHEDHGDALVPLFNIRGAAAGVENTWQRAEFAADAVTLIETDPTALVSGYANTTNPNQRSAYLDTLKHAEMADVELVQSIAIKGIAETPTLTPVLGATAAITGDMLAVQQLLINGSGSGLSSALMQIDKRLETPEMSILLEFAVEQAPAENAALAMAAWWPRLKHDPASRDLMLATLADPELGPGAALALAQNPDIQTIKALQDTARGDSNAARRAQMALDFNRARLVGEAQQ